MLIRPWHPLHVDKNCRSSCRNWSEFPNYDSKKFAFDIQSFVKFCWSLHSTALWQFICPFQSFFGSKFTDAISGSTGEKNVYVATSEICAGWSTLMIRCCGSVQGATTMRFGRRTCLCGIYWWGCRTLVIALVLLSLVRHLKAGIGLQDVWAANWMVWWWVAKLSRAFW